MHFRENEADVTGDVSDSDSSGERGVGQIQQLWIPFYAQKFSFEQIT